MTQFTKKITLLLSMLVIFIGLPQCSLAQVSEEMEVSRQEFVDMSLNMAEKASEQRVKIKQQQEARLRESMDDEQFKNYQAETLKSERAAEDKLATCLGMSHKKLKSFEDTMGVEFQLGAIEQCKSTLPEKITMSGSGDLIQSPALEPYVSCMEALAVEKMGVSADKIKRCASGQSQ